jgi:AcrR family transcriptional regulator
MSDSLVTEPTRRLLTPRQADTVHRLTAAGVQEVRASGYENLSIRDVARRAGVAPATAYTYFASKDHLLTEIFWRRLNALPSVEPAGPPDRDKVVAVLRELALLVSAEPELAAGCTAAMFGSEPDVRQLRLYIGVRIHQRIEAAAGAGTPAARLLELAYFGAMVEAGLGYTTYEHMADRLAEAVELIMG